MNLKKSISFCAVIAAILIAGTQTSCYKDSKEALFPIAQCDTANITWNKDIKPFVSNTCAISGCHDAATASGGYALNDYAGVKLCVDYMRFLIVMEQGTMPKNSSKLDPCTINKVRRWINTGALEN